MANEQENAGSEPSWIRVDEGAHDETLFESWLFRLRRERFRSRASGKIHDFYVTHLADGVHVIALTADQQLVLVRQFRAGSGRDSLETPGGLLDAGEDPCAAGAGIARRNRVRRRSTRASEYDLPDPGAALDADQYDRDSKCPAGGRAAP